MSSSRIKWYAWFGVLLFSFGHYLDHVMMAMQVIKTKSDYLLFAIPIYVFLLSFFAGKPLGRLGLLHHILFASSLACFSIFFQVFFCNNISIFYIIFSFICLGCMWAIGSILSIIANQNTFNSSLEGVNNSSIEK